MKRPQLTTKMKPENPNKRRKTLIIISIAAAAVVLIAGIGYAIYAWQQSQQPKQTAQSTNNSTSSQTTTKDEEKTTPSTTPATDPYAGWLSASLKYEKVSFKYPSTWKLTNTSTPHSESDAVTPGYDKATLVSPTGLTLTVSTGVYGIGGGPYGNHVFTTTPITTLGGSYYLGFGTYQDDSNLVSKGTVGTKQDKTASMPLSKNISVTSSDTRPFNAISMAYYDAAGNAIEKQVSDFQNDASYNDTLLIIKSLTY